MQKYRELTIRELKHQFPVSHVTDELSDDIFIAELRYASEMDIIKHPCRFDGYLAFFCYEGHFDIEVNLRTFQVREGSLFLYTPRPGPGHLLDEPAEQARRRLVTHLVHLLSDGGAMG